MEKINNVQKIDDVQELCCSYEKDNKEIFRIAISEDRKSFTLKSNSNIKMPIDELDMVLITVLNATKSVIQVYDKLNIK